MSEAPPVRLRWQDRIGRARHLAARHPAASELLTFYAAVAERQLMLAERWDSEIDAWPDDGLSLERCVPIVLDALDGFLPWLERMAPPRLVDALTESPSSDDAGWQEALGEYLSGQRIPVPKTDDSTKRSLEQSGRPRVEARSFVLEALLQPLAELVSARKRRRPSSVAHTGPVGSRESLTADTGAARQCPLCGSRPLAGVLREEGHGSKRSLLCGLCLNEWAYRRLLCPACGEDRFDALPVFTADGFEHARVEGCDTCRRYLKTIDLGKDGLAVPIVDDLATVALDLWARGQGYVRMRPNVLRT